MVKWLARKKRKLRQEYQNYQNRLVFFGNTGLKRPHYETTQFPSESEKD
jgi:hypothetical protein